MGKDKQKDKKQAEAVVNYLFTPQRRLYDLSPVCIYIRTIQDEAILSYSHEQYRRFLRRFYAIRRSNEYIDYFISLIPVYRSRLISGNETVVSLVEDIVLKLREQNGRGCRDISFASKLLHVADPSHSVVIYDRLVKGLLGIPNSHTDYNEVYSKFNELSQDFQKKEYGRIGNFYSYQCFDALFSERSSKLGILVSENKKIDFYLWALGHSELLRVG